MTPSSIAAHRTIEAVWRIEAARLIGGLARTVHDVALAEDLAQDALVAALEQWPQSGVPDNPGAWLAAVARRRGVDAIRRAVTLNRKLAQLSRDAVEDPMHRSRSARRWTTMCCGWCSPPVIPRCRRRRAWH